MTHRLWEERPDLLKSFGWKPYPTRAAAQQQIQRVWGDKAFDRPDAVAVADEDLTFDVVAEWESWTFAHRVIAARETGKKDPRPSRHPFGWLTTA